MTVERSKLTRELSGLLAGIADKNALPGIAASVTQAGSEIFAVGLGARDADGRLPVTADTMFGVASVTKFLTAVLIMRAHARNLLSLSDPVSRFYPALDCARDGRMRLHHLLSHSAGFPGLPFRHRATEVAFEGNGEVILPDPEYRPAANRGGEQLLAPADLVEGINALTFEVLGAPGDRLSYSNEGYCLLGGIIEDLFQCSFADAAESLVFQPLNMRRSTVGGKNLQDRTNIAVPLLPAETGLRQSAFWEAPLFYPAGGLVVSVRDMVRLISTLDGDTDVLTSEQAARMISGPMPIASRPSRNVGYGLGLELEQLDANDVLAWHTGQRPGISSFVGHVPQRKLSVAVAVNVADAPTAAIGHEIIARILAHAGDSGSVVWPPRNERFEADHFEHLSGCYGSSEMGAFHVELQDERLVLKTQSGTREFQFEGPRNGTVGECTFCFLDEAGHAPLAQTPAALALDLRILPRFEIAHS